MFDAKEYNKKYYEKNKERLNKQSKEYYKANKDRLLDLQKVWARERLYNVTEEDYKILLKNSNGKCQICSKDFIKTPHIDHCHTTGKVRGLLCKSCNTALGFYEKYKENFARYLNEN